MNYLGGAFPKVSQSSFTMVKMRVFLLNGNQMGPFLGLHGAFKAYKKNWNYATVVPPGDQIWNYATMGPPGGQI